MNRLIKSLLIATVSLATLSLVAQDAERPRREGGRPGGPGGPEGGRPRGGSPIVQALDADKNQEISAAEITGAAAALKTLDKDGDGKLVAEEFRGGRPGGDRRPEPTAAEGAPERPRRVMPLVATLDVDSDGEISAAEITNAPGVLKTLDKNSDGTLTPDEFGGGPRGGGKGGERREGRPGKPAPSA